MGEDNVQQLKMVADLFRHSKMAEILLSSAHEIENLRYEVTKLKDEIHKTMIDDWK